MRAAAIASFRVRWVELARFAPGFLTAQLFLGVGLRLVALLTIANPPRHKAVWDWRAQGVNPVHT